MSAKYILITRFQLKNHIGNEQLKTLKNSPEKKYFLSDESGFNELLELRAFDNIAAIAACEAELETAFHIAAKYLAGDVRRELIKFVEAPIESENSLPETEYIQLRHVEVPAEKYNKYLQWREETIFNVVRDNKKKITSFCAYHSLISGQPGVMFISAFTGDKSEYRAVFTNKRYQAIIQEAGDNYITGGNEGLYTCFYRSISYC